MKKALRLALVLTAMVMLFASAMAVSASAKDVAYYYIDSVNGIDHTTGNDPNVPLRTFTEAYIVHLVGDKKNHKIRGQNLKNK